mgnify:CR=1 FL=1
MGKGLPRSLSRGDKRKQELVKERIRISGTVSVLAAGAGVGFGTLVIGDFPEGNILFLGAVTNINFSGTGSDANLVDAWNGDFGIGTGPDANGTLTGIEVDIIASAAIGPAAAEIAPVVRAVNATQAIFDNTDGSLEINLNVLIDAADIADAATVVLTVTGELLLCYTVLSDD